MARHCYSRHLHNCTTTMLQLPMLRTPQAFLPQAQPTERLCGLGLHTFSNVHTMHMHSKAPAAQATATALPGHPLTHRHCNIIACGGSKKSHTRSLPVLLLLCLTSAVSGQSDQLTTGSQPHCHSWCCWQTTCLQWQPSTTAQSHRTHRDLHGPLSRNKLERVMPL